MSKIWGPALQRWWANARGRLAVLLLHLFVDLSSGIFGLVRFCPLNIYIYIYIYILDIRDLKRSPRFGWHYSELSSSTTSIRRSLLRHFLLVRVCLFFFRYIYIYILDIRDLKRSPRFGWHYSELSSFTTSIRRSFFRHFSWVRLCLSYGFIVGVWQSSARSLLWDCIIVFSLAFLGFATLSWMIKSGIDHWDICILILKN